MPPLTLVSYEVVLHHVVDFSRGFDPTHWPPLWQELTCDWRRLAFYKETEPPSWVLADQVLSAGGRGVLFPSQRAAGVNLVVFPDALTPADQLSVYDPAQRLPRDRSSWTHAQG